MANEQDEIRSVYGKAGGVIMQSDKTGVHPLGMPLLNPAPVSAIISTRIELRCGCGDCHRPFAYLEGHTLVIISRHAGQEHRNVIPLISAVSLFSEINHATDEPTAISNNT